MVVEVRRNLQDGQMRIVAFGDVANRACSESPADKSVSERFVSETSYGLATDLGITSISAE